MAKFKIGDRVKMLRDSNCLKGLKEGEVGTITENSMCPFVRWDNSDLNKASGGSLPAWAVPERLLELIDEKENKMTKEEFIEKYQGKLVNVKTKELAIEFFELANSFGWCCYSGNNLLVGYTCWEYNKEKTIYKALENGKITLKFDVDDVSEPVVEFESIKQPKLQQPQKSLLKSGDKVVYENGQERFVLVETNTLHDKEGRSVSCLNGYSDNLALKCTKEYAIMKVYRNNEIIMQRTEKSDRELKIEELQRKMDELKAEMEGLK